MKIRIQKDRIRLRLSQSEVDKIGTANPVVEHTHFGENRLTYCLVTHIEGDPILASFDNTKISISLRQDLAKNWSLTDQVGLQTEPNEVPFVLIEKDFKCLTVRAGEDESDLFQNPNTTC